MAPKKTPAKRPAKEVDAALEEERKRKNRERQVEYRRRRAERRKAELVGAAATRRVEGMNAARGRGRGGGRAGARQATTQHSTTDPATTQGQAVTADVFSSSTPVDNPGSGASAEGATLLTSRSGAANIFASSTVQVSKDPLEAEQQPLGGIDATPDRAETIQSASASAPQSGNSLPQYARDFGWAGREGGGPSFYDMLVSFLSVPEQIPDWKEADAARRRQMFFPLQESCRSLGMAERTTDSLISKVNYCLFFKFVPGPY